MAARNVAIVLTALALALFIAACGGSGTTSDTAGLKGSDQAFANWLAGVDLTTTTQSIDGLPGIPIDSASDARRASAVESPVIKLGVDHMDALNYVDEGTAVHLEAPAEGHPPIAYAMYKIEGLTGLHPTVLDVEATPGSIEESYFVGVADYTIMNWRWFGPYSMPEIEINLANHDHRYISAAGNFYFLTVVHEGMSLTHYQSSLFLNEQGEGGLPGAPFGLHASDGEIPDGVGLVWNPGPGSEYFEIFRTIGGDNDGMHHEWMRIGESIEPNYFDQAVDPGVVYLYKVRAGNPHGFSGFSNVDSGFAGEAPPPPPDGFRIHGWVRTAGADGAVGEPVANIEVTLFGPPQPITVHTNADGAYAFNHLPAGSFIVVPHNPEVGFEPIYTKAFVGPDHPVAEVNFTAFLHDLPTWRIWGFVFKGTGDPAHPGMQPLPGVAVKIQCVEPEGEPFVVETNADGFYAAYEQPVGVYTITPSKPGFRFEPTVHEVHVTHQLVTDMKNFMAIPDGGGQDGCAIKGFITNADGAALHEIAVSLVPGGPGADGGLTFTNADGLFVFDNLAPGKYLVVPHAPNRLFEPRYSIVVLEPGMLARRDFVGTEQQAFHRLWGFTFNMQGDSANGFALMNDVLISVRLDGQHDGVTTHTNADGFWEIMELANGLYIVTPSFDGFAFDPPHHVQEINGQVITPPLFFHGGANQP